MYRPAITAGVSAVRTRRLFSPHSSTCAARAQSSAPGPANRGPSTCSGAHGCSVSTAPPSPPTTRASGELASAATCSAP
ncbi:hypothetical protein ACFQ0B_73735 [Nonomuraea thailandensis]